MKLARCLAAAAAGFLVPLVSSHAAVFEISPGNTQSLRTAIQTAVTNGEDDVINLAPGALYLIQTADNSTASFGANGLPIISADGARSLTINGRGAIIVNASSQPLRFLQVNPNASLTIEQLTLRDGRAFNNAPNPSGGGAILNDRGNVTLIDCTLLMNSATNGPGSPFPVGGGAIYNTAGTLTLRGCTFQNNTVGSSPVAPSGSQYSGGAIYNINGIVRAQICTFWANQAILQPGNSGSTTMVSGGAIANTTSGSNPSAELTVSNCTLAGNSASAPPGPMVVGTTISNAGSGTVTTIGSSILAGSGQILFNGNGSGFSSAGFNLTNGDGGGFLTAVGDQVNTDPQLRPLANNGGFTGTCALPVTSPALDRGKRDVIPALAVATDQRGTARPYDFGGATAPGAGDRSDVGAFELTPTLIVTTTADPVPPDGTCDAAGCTLREAINAANAQPNTDTIAFAPGVTGIINLTERLPELKTNLEIAGPGADRLTLRRHTGINYRLFFVSDLVDDSTGPEVALADLTLINGQAPGSGSAGGAIYNDFGRLGLARCVVQGNSAANGAGIFNFRGTVNVWDSTFRSNTATGFGGAFSNSAAQGPATINITNSTLVANTAARGAAIYNNGSTGNAKTTLLNATFSDNASAFGSIYGEGSTANITLRNTLLNAPAGTPNFILANNATVTSQGNNLSNDAAGGGPDTAPGGLLNQSGDQRNKDPRLDPAGLQDNGGTTPTVALLSDSPAINAGNNTAATSLDQRGYGRAGTADIGAFEFAGIEPPPAPTPPPTPTPVPTATPAPNRFANISTRMRVEAGDNVLIGGFIVTGSMQKRIIVRALGPSLEVGGKLENPTLELYNASGTLLASNDNWKDAPNAQEIFDSTIPPKNDLESAILQNVELGAHTAIVSGVDGGTGVGLVEVYDLGNNQDSKLANISTRGRVLTGDNVMIAGLIATGSSPQKVIVRAIGASLDVAGRLENPFLELFDGNGNPITSNDNWKDTQQAEIEATGIPPSNDLESAIVTFLPPAPYTALVRGVEDSTGIAVIEVYALQ